MACSARCAITAVTAQNTRGVVCWQALPADLVTAQIEAVVGDLGADAVKIGMLANAAIVEAVAAAIRCARSSSGGRRSGDDRERRRPIARSRCRRRDEIGTAANGARRHAERARGRGARRHVHPLGRRHARGGKRILRIGPRVVLVKGGHLEGPDSIDVACTASGTFELRRPRILTPHTHGTGCTLSSAIAANLARARPIERRSKPRANTSMARSGMRRDSAAGMDR